MGKLKPFLNPRKPLTGRALRHSARALTRLSIKPQESAYRRLVAELQGQRAADLVGLNRLGNQTTRTVAGLYGGLQASGQGTQINQAAIGNLLGRNVAASNQAAQQQVQAGQEGNIGGYLQSLGLRGAPGGGMAQQQLANLVSLQQGAQAANSQAAQNFASSQGAAYSGLAGGMTQAGQMQGAQLGGDIQREIASRIADARLKEGADIREALGKLADVKALKGSTLIQNLLSTRKQEQDYLLGRAATRQSGRNAALSAATSRANAQLSAATSTANSRRAARTSRQNNRRTNANSGSGSRGNRRDNQQTRGNVKAALLNDIRQVGWSSLLGKGDKARHHRNALERDVNTSTNAALVHKILRHLLKKHKQGGGGHHGGRSSGSTGSGGHPGQT